MKSLKITLACVILSFIISCHRAEKKPLFQGREAAREALTANLPIDQGFSEYISSYTSGIIPSSSVIEVHFTEKFAAAADRKVVSGLFTFKPDIKGKTEWKDNETLVFTPSKPLDQGKVYSGKLNIGKIAAVKDRLREFPFSISTLKKDFRVMAGALEALQDGSGYRLSGTIITSDVADPAEVEKFLEVRLEKKAAEIRWDHSDPVSHVFTIPSIARTGKDQKLVISWDGREAGVKQKGSASITIPAFDRFMVLDVIRGTGENQKTEIVLSDPVDASQDLTGLVRFGAISESSVSVNSNIISIVPGVKAIGKVDLIIEGSLRDSKGSTLGSTFTTQLDFSTVPPGIKMQGNGVIIPSSQNLVFPFLAANLKSVDLKIIKIFENNLPYFLQESDMSGGYSMKRFGRTVYSGKVDLVNMPGMNSGGWNLYTIDLSEYIQVEPGVLYKVSLGMRKSYSLYPCAEGIEKEDYEKLLDEAEQQSRETWNDPENYYDDPADAIYYSYGFNWEDRDNPCKEAYYSPDRRQTRNILASNLGLIAKMGDDKKLHVMVNDLISALPVPETTLEVYDYQIQRIAKGTTNQDGSAIIDCGDQPFLLIASKDKDRNYLKLNDASALPLSSFDVSGARPEKGIKAFIYGERDVWRPGDSIFLTLIIKDMKAVLPADHPVQFELINPLEQKVDNQVSIPGKNNMAVFTSVTSSDAVTGNYKAVFRIGGATFTKRVRIETIKPNRLKLNLSFGKEVLGGADKTTRGTLNVKWLNGNVAGGLSSSVEYLLKPVKTTFAKYPQYDFDDPINEFISETVSIFDGQVDEKGDAEVVFRPSDELHAPGMMNAVFTVKAMEPGGDESIIQTSYKYSPYNVYAGINLPGLTGKSRMLFTDQDNQVKVVTLDDQGRPVNSELQVSMYKLTYRWWWESDHENLGYYISNKIYRPVLEKTITTKNGEGSFSFNIDRNNWGRFLIRVSTPGGHATGKILLVDWPWDYGMKGNNDGATLLSVSTDKEKYKPGDDITISFPSPENARAIITLENATGVLDELRTATKKGSTEVKFRARPEMAPNVYAYVSVIQPHAQSINDMPVRLYGIVPVMIEDTETRLSPVLEMPDELRSGKPFVIKVGESSKKPMSYTLAVVDEGLLDITGFKTPDPWNYFYAREALGVRTWDLYDNVLGVFGGTLDRILGVGGDEVLNDKAAGKAQRFIPVVKFLGPFSLEAGKSNSHVITLPQYTGSVKVMVVGGNDRSFGSAEKTVPVRDPLMLLVTAPRVISPGETVSLPVTLFVQKEGLNQVLVEVKNNDLISFTENKKQVKVEAKGETDLEFSFSAGTKTGIAKISVTASGGNEKAVYNLELDIRSPNPPESRAEMRILQAGEKWQSAFTTFGVEGSNSAKLEISDLPSINLEKRLDYLVHYPYGCSEQVTSGAFPQLYLRDILGKDAAALQQVPSNIKEAINMIVSRQMANGGIAMWPGSYQADNWITSYAGHFMLEAEKTGYSIPSGFRQKWIDYQQAASRDWVNDNVHRYTQNDQAYRLFTLALAGKPEKGAMNRLREIKDLTSISRWMLSAAFALTGRNEVANDLLDMRNTSTEPEYSWYYYGSEIRDRSVILYTLTILKKQQEALPLLKEICDRFNSDQWYSTQSISWGLSAYLKWIKQVPAEKGKQSRVSIAFNGARDSYDIPSGQLFTTDLTVKDGSNQMLIENTSETPVYVTLTQKGIPLTTDATASQKGLSLKVEYYDLHLKPVDHKNLTQGTDLIMVVRVSNNTFSRIDNVALTQMMPSGWEIRNTRLLEADYGIKEGSFDYRDFRDDRVNTFFSLDQGQNKTFATIVNAAYTGEFFQPSIICEAMYTPDCFARVPGTKVKVIKAGN